MGVKRAKQRGMQVIYFIGLMVIIVLISSVILDLGMYFAAQNRLQTVADAASLGATAELYHSDSVDPMDRQTDATLSAGELAEENWSGTWLEDGDVTFGYIDPDEKTYDAGSFEEPTADPRYVWSGGYNAVRVLVRRTRESRTGPLPTVVAKAFGINTMDATAMAVAFMDQDVVSVERGGIRPIYACQAQLDRAMLDGIPGNNTVRIYGDRMEVDGVGNIPGCPPPGSGNWGFADLRNCGPDVPGSSDTSEWFMNGYQGRVDTRECYSTQSGNFLVNAGVQAALNKLIQDEEVIMIPVYDDYNGTGSNTRVHVSGFVGFVITGYQAHGSAGNRHIRGHFTRAICRGVCTTGESTMTPGAGVVKLRLAARDL